MTEQVEKVGRPKCDHCGREYYQHIQADGMRLCPVSAFAYRPASSTPPDDSVARIVELEGALRELHEAMADVMMLRRISTTPEQREIAYRAIAVWRKNQAVLGETSSAEGRGLDERNSSRDHGVRS